MGEGGVTVVDLVEGQVDAHPDALAIRAEDGELTYGGVDRLANRLAHAVLRADPDRRCANVGVLLPCGRTPPVAMVASAKAGRVLVALDVASPPSRLAELLGQAGPAVVITDRAHRGGLPVGTTVVLVDDLDEDLPCTRPHLAIDPDQPLQVTFTSGSTGRPKGALRTHRAQVHSVRKRVALSGYGPGLRISLVYEIAFAASRVTVWAGLGNGCSIHVRDVRAHGPAGLAEWLAEEQVARLQAPASLVDAMVALGVPDGALDRLEAVTFSGDLLRVDTVERLRCHLAPTAEIRNSYGSSEMGGVAELVIRSDTVLEGELVPAGRLRADVEVRIAEPDARGVGEIEVSGPTVSIGYVDESTDRRGFHQDDGQSWFRSGDLGRIRDDGLLEVVGRLDDRVKVRAQTIDPAEVERALLHLPEVADAHVSAREVGGHIRLVAYVGPATGTTPTVSSVRRALRPAVPDWMIPQSVVVLDPLPRTDRGKVDRAALPDPGAARPDLEVAFAPPETPLEQAVVDVFEAVLAVDGIGRADEFFDLGGDSLNAVEVVVALGKALDRDLSLDAFRATATPAAIADRLTHEPEGPEDRFVVFQDSGTGTPVAFIHSGHGYTITMAGLAASTGGTRPFYGVQMLHRDRPKDALSVDGLAGRYAELLAGRVEGPIVVAGYSGGGVLAHAVAAALRDRRREVAGLVLLDPVSGARPGPRLKQRLYLLAAQVGWRAGSSRLVQQRMAVSAFGARRHRPTPIDVPIVVLRSEVADPTQWEALTTIGVHVEDVTGDHLAMLHPPHLATLAEVLERSVQRLEGRRPSASAATGEA